ncbi:MAG: lipocalin-like domain-containing protein [Acidimicrobiia bacterium]|nr:lipocalin-like domain-containing protein [Acidimicrobiia bacterium]
MQSLVGHWVLEEWTATVDGTVVHPFGGRADGFLTYTADGRMWAALQRRDRAPLGTGTLAAASAEQRAAAAAGYLAYGGRYTTDGERVVHHVETSLFPDWIGGDQIRLIDWDGDRLVLSTPPETSTGGRSVVNRLRWRR